PEALPTPRPLPSADPTFPYDGGPRAPVPMPTIDPAPKAAPPGAAPLEGRSVSLPAKPAKLTFPAYGQGEAKPTAVRKRHRPPHPPSPGPTSGRRSPCHPANRSRGTRWVPGQSFRPPSLQDGLVSRLRRRFRQAASPAPESPSAARTRLDGSGLCIACILTVT